MIQNSPRRIAITADPELPVPPRLYGGIERVIDMLARGLVERGYDVSVFAHRESNTAGRLIPWPGSNSRKLVDTARNASTLARVAAVQGFDLIHSFSRIAYLTPLLPTPIPKLMTYQRPISRRSIQAGHLISGGTLWFTAISRWMMRHVEDVGTWRLVFNGVPLRTYRFRADRLTDAPLVFLGRVEEIKGPHLAIDIAIRAGRRLIIAGNIPPEHQAWFDHMIAPRIDGDQVAYIGPVDDERKNELLGTAHAFLMPILWDEPFGIVMAEALACGTPVLGTCRGAVPEVVEHGRTGFVCENVTELADAVARVDQLSRADCRRHVEELFSETAVINAYTQVYDEMLTRQPRAVQGG
jgi:glycosyltransferase involved in cell wall biosynthesis